MNASPVTLHSSPSTALQLYSANSFPSPLDSYHNDSFAQRFIIPTNADPSSSGFPYHPRLRDLNVSLDEWHHFTSDILKAGRLTIQEDYAAWSTGIVAGTLATSVVLVFGPLAGYAAAKFVHKKVVVSKVKERLLKDGDMRSILQQWNEGIFAGKGFQAWLELPVEGDLADLDAHPEVNDTKTKTKKEKKAAQKTEKKAKRRFKIVIIPENEQQKDCWSRSRSPALLPAEVPAVTLVEAPEADHKSPVEMYTGSSGYIQPLVNHQQEILPEGERDKKYEYRPIPPEIKPDHDITPMKESRKEEPPNPSTDVANGRVPESEIIPEDEKLGRDTAYNDPAVFEIDSDQVPAASKV